MNWFSFCFSSDRSEGGRGRLIHHLEHTPGFVRSLERLEAVVLDEVDLLLELGFMPQVRAIYTTRRSVCD